MYKVSMEEARWGELCPDMFLPALMIGVKCSRFRLSVNLMLVANGQTEPDSELLTSEFKLDFLNSPPTSI